MSEKNLVLELEELEKKDMVRSGLYTGGIILLMLLSLFIWVALRMNIPAPLAKEYEMIGSIDFGNMQQGRSDVNNFEDPTETPADAPPPSESNPTPPVDVNPTPPQNQDNVDVINNDDNSDVSTPDDPTPDPTPDPIPDPIPDPVPDPAPDPVPDPIPDPAPDPVPDPNPNNTGSGNGDNDNNNDNQNGGSDHGNSNTPGNSGHPDAKELDPNGLYTFGGPGGGGLPAGRWATGLKDPVYTVQEEAKITFEFKINAFGKVTYVKPPITSHLGLKKAGMDAIYRWKFNEVDEFEKDVWTKVSITFKLK